MIEKIRKVAVVGTGFAGLSLGFQLTKLGIYPDFYEDPSLPAASLIATGLLHLFHGAQARIPPLGQEAMQESLAQLEQLGSFTSYAQKITLVRPALNKMQESTFAKQAKRYPEQASYKNLPWDPQQYGLWIDHAYWVNSALYLQCLRAYLEKHGCNFKKQRVYLPDLENLYDQAAFACGYGSLLIEEIRDKNLESHLTRGQLGYISIEKPPQFALNGKTYLIPRSMSQEGSFWVFGSTFEKLPLDSVFDGQTYDLQARLKLIEQTQELWPFINVEKASWDLGYRLAGPNHLPWIGQLSEKSYAFTGLGSKGLLYSAYLAKKLASCMHSQKPFEYFHLESSSSKKLPKA